MKKLNKLFCIIFLTFIFSMPLSVYAYTDKVYLGGENIGIEVNSKGVLIVGFYKVNDKYPGKDAGLLVGDIITEINDKEIKSSEDLQNLKEEKELSITYLRDNKKNNTTLILENEENIYKTGLYIKDKIIGIGTLTFIDPESNIYGALGHQINESTTGLKFEIKDGTIFKSDVTEIERSEDNLPGEKNAKYYIEDVYGNVIKNTKTGIYGEYTKDLSNKELINVSDINDIKTGDAYIRTVISGSKEEIFKINILKINKNDETKNILFEITDEALLSKTNGIVQGMSGSPIIQNNKIIGAVTHVVVENPKKGYGIFINNMLKDAN